jgi:hypothetical protein
MATREAGSSYENVREIVSESLARLPDAELEQALGQRNIDAQVMEGFFDDLSKFAAKAAPAVLPIAGQVIGGIYGGPAGAAIGGQLGSMAGGAIASATGQQRGAAPPPAGAPAAMPSPAPGAGSPAASQLLQTVTRPEVLQAIASMAMGSAGRSNVSVGNTSVPVSAFTNLLGVLAGRAEAEYAASMARSPQSLPDYLIDYAGEAKADPAVEENRAGALYELLAREAERDVAESESESESESEGEAAMEWSESEADAAELVELEYELAEAEGE